MKGIILIANGELSEEAKAKLKKLEEARKKKVEKIVKDFREKMHL